VSFDQTSEQYLKVNHLSHNVCLEKITLPWEKLGRVEVIKSWAEEMKLAIASNASLDDWRIIGHAVTIIHDNEDDCQKILQRVAFDIGLDYQFIDCFNVHKKLVLIEGFFDIKQPRLIYLGSGKWMGELEEDASEEAVAVQENLCALVRSFDPQFPVIFVISAYDLSDITEKFRSVGLFDRRFNVIKPSLEEMASNFIEMMGEPLCGQDIKEALGKVGKLLDLEFDDKRRQALIAMTLKRIAKKENRKIIFSDLVNLALKGIVEYDPYPERSHDVLKRTAIHEAGHALISILDSSGDNIPEYVGVIESCHYSGVVADSFDYHYSINGKRSYKDFRHRVRILLAGRAAEHFMLGIENISVISAKDDLKRAGEMSYEMFAHHGLPSKTDCFEDAIDNLSVFLDKNSQALLSKVEKITREFIKNQYRLVYGVLEENKEKLELIANRLLVQSVLNQQDLITILRTH
jgi:hypothetical protein